MADADVIDGGRVGESFRAGAEGVRPLFAKFVALHAANGDHSLDIGEGKLVSFQVAFVGGEKSHEASAGGMAGDKNSVGSTAVLGDVTNGPSKCAGHILDVSGMPDRGRKAITGCHEADPLLGEGFAERPHVLTVSRPQGAAVNPKENGEVLPAFR